MLHPVYIGCDVSKSHLDLFDPRTGKPFRIANTPSVIAAWARTLRSHPIRVVMEATGRYDGALRAQLARNGIAYCRINPARARDFAKALGLLAKTDAIDARMLARLGQTLAPAKTPSDDPDRIALSALCKRRDQLVAMRQAERVRLHEAAPDEQASLVRHLGWLDAEIAVIEAACRASLDQNERLHALESRLRSIPGIGTVTALALVAHMPELGSLNPKALAALAGLAPFNADSGTRHGQRRIRGGRKRVRDALYMAALAAARSNSRLKAFAQSLKQRGKPFKVVIIALARKILLIANALVRQNTRFINT